MRNLVSLRRQLRPLEAAASPYAAFALGEEQAFFLRSDGRIDVLALDDERASPSSPEPLADLRACVPSAIRWTWLAYVAEQEALACISADGALAIVDVRSRAAEEIGALDGGVCGVAWSSNQEMLAVATGAGALLVMNAQWEVLHETQLDAALPAGFTRRESAEGEELALCWRDDAQYLVANVPVVDARGAAAQKVVVFTAQLELHALGRLEDGRAIPQLGAALAWSPNHALIASSEARREQLFVVFFERNGLRHGEFALPAHLRAAEFRVAQVGWNVDSDVLAVALEGLPSGPGGPAPASVLQLWTRGNYHWYLKQERRLHAEADAKRLLQFMWDDEYATRLHMLTLDAGRGGGSGGGALLQEEFVWDVSRSERDVLSRSASATTVSGVVTGVIDGSTLLLTPLHQALVPPPMALHQLAFPAVVNAVVFDSQSEALAVLLATGELVMVEDYLSSAATQTVVPQQNHEEEEDADPAVSTLSSLLWMRLTRDAESRSLSLVAKSGWDDALVVGSAALLADAPVLSVAYPPALDGVRRAAEVVYQAGAIGSPTIAVQTHDGTVYTLSPLESDADGDCFLAELSDRYPAFTQLIVIAPTRIEPTDAGSFLVLGLQSSAKLFVNDALVAPACSTFRYCPRASVLLFATLGSHPQLRMVPLEGLERRKFDAYESRALERGAKLVAVVGDRANVVVQMPRGNLECVAPRVLVLALAVQQIKQLQYVAALELCRKHRLDLNVLVDFDPEAFLAHFAKHLVRRLLADKPAPVTSDRLCLFITNLHPVDVWRAKYEPQVAPFVATRATAPPATSGDNVNVVCRAMMQTIREIEGSRECAEAARSALLLPFLTAAVKQSPPQYADALAQLQTLLRGGDGLAAAKRALKHLVLLAPVDVLYDEALGLYDVELVRFVATHSQRDPKEYAPFLDALARMAPNADLLKYTIDVYLGRYAKALVHVSALALGAASDEAARRQYEDDAVAVVTRGALHDEAIALFPPASASPAARAFQRRLALLKGEHLEATHAHEAAAYVYLSEAAYVPAQRAFLAAGLWQMGLSLALRAKQPASEVQALAYQVAQKLLGRVDGTAGATVSDDAVLSAARIYVEYCRDVDEAVALLVANRQYDEALRVAYVHARADLVESDVETGVLQALDAVLDEIAASSAAYVAHWTRLTTLREQKRLFRLHGLDGSRWQQDGGGDGDGVESVHSGAPSAADSALSSASMRSVGSHNSALSIGNFAMKPLAQATASHFYATQTIGGAAASGGSSKPAKKVRLSRNERRNKIKKGSAEEEQFVLQQCEKSQPSAALRQHAKALLRALVLFGHVQKAQALQSRLAAFERLVAVEYPLAPADSASTQTRDEGLERNWTLSAIAEAAKLAASDASKTNVLMNKQCMLPSSAILPRFLLLIENDHQSDFLRLSRRVTGNTVGVVWAAAAAAAAHGLAHIGVDLGATHGATPNATLTVTDTDSTNVTRCDEELLFQKLYVLMPAINQCAKEAGYLVQSSTLTAPSNASLDKFCASANCTKLTAELEDAGLPSCTVQVGTTEMPFKDFFSQIKAHCPAGGGRSKKSAASASTSALGWRVGVTAVVAALLVVTGVSV
ncbi:hypothetical protein PybrP1_003989 [[Pythium] brassicae (nom. inval.)]|nr:hypothetical protein PybrP1_003989 [[Pythium] brassicae (nom. inval.)]